LCFEKFLPYVSALAATRSDHPVVNIFELYMGCICSHVQAGKRLVYRRLRGLQHTTDTQLFLSTPTSETEINRFKMSCVCFST
jgi:hypothetical protein